jgi:hypothetical protein
MMFFNGKIIGKNKEWLQQRKKAVSFIKTLVSVINNKLGCF